MKIRLHTSLPLLLAAAALNPAPVRAIPTWPDDQPPTSLFYVSEPYPWVYYNPHYGEAGHSAYKGVWRIPNNWPGKDAPDGRAGDVTIRHTVYVNNERYYTIGGPSDPGVIPFPGTAGGYLECNDLDIEPNGELTSTLEILSFDGNSVWSGGYISAGTWKTNAGTTGGAGRLRNKGVVTVTGKPVVGRGGGIFHNTNRILIDTIIGDPGASLGIHAGHAGLLNESGELPDPSEAVIELRGSGNSISNPPGGGGAYPVIINYGVLRRSNPDLEAEPGSSTIAVQVENHAESTRNRAGTVQVDRGTLIFDTGGFGYSTWYGMKAQLAAGTQAILRGSHYFRSGVVTTSGTGVLRLEGSPGNVFAADTGVTDAVFNAPFGTIECAGAELRRIVNEGSISVVNYSPWREVVNKGLVLCQASLGITLFTNGQTSERDAVLEMNGESDIVPFNGGAVLQNYGLLRKTGAGTLDIQGDSYHYGSGSNLNIEVQSGILLTTNNVYFQNGANIRVANGAEVQFNYRNYHDGGGTLNFSGSGKYYLNSGSFLSTNTPNEARTFNSAPGVFDCRGGELAGPFTNAGEITVSAPSAFVRSFIGDNPITNAGTIHCLAASAGTNGSYSVTLHALVRIPCAATSVLSFDIAGRPTDYTQWARLLHGGQSSITYDGSLRINFGNFTPVSGDRWLVIQNDGSTANSGDFARVEFTNVPAGFTPTYEKIATGIRVGLNAAPAPVNYGTWTTAQNFPAPAAGAFDADPDGDGFSNGLECAMGTDPQSRSSLPAINAVRQDSGGDQFLTARFRRPAAAFRPTDVQYIAERSDSLGGWTTSGLVVDVSPPDAQNMETMIVRPAEPMDMKNHTFIRLRVQQNP